jgi:hypothetical protein
MLIIFFYIPNGHTRAYLKTRLEIEIDIQYLFATHTNKQLSHPLTTQQHLRGTEHLTECVNEKSN